LVRLTNIAIDYSEFQNNNRAVKLTFEDLEFEVNVVLSREEAREKGQRVIRQ